MHAMWLFDTKWGIDSAMDDYYKNLLDEKMEPFLAVKDQYRVQYDYDIVPHAAIYSLECKVIAHFQCEEDAMLFKLKYQDLLNELR